MSLHSSGLDRVLGLAAEDCLDIVAGSDLSTHMIVLWRTESHMTGQFEKNRELLIIQITQIIAAAGEECDYFEGGNDLLTYVMILLGECGKGMSRCEKENGLK